MQKLKIAIILGTKRQARRSIHAARLIYKLAGEFDEVEPVFVDPAELDLPADGNDEINKDPNYTKIIQEADGFFIVVPEYNHSFPGSLKRTLDSEYKHYFRKPAALAGVSSGPWGGVRAIESLLPVLRTLGMIIVTRDVQFPHIQKVFDNEGNLQEKVYIERIKKVFQELIWMARVMRFGRENLERESKK